MGREGQSVLPGTMDGVFDKLSKAIKKSKRVTMTD